MIKHLPFTSSLRKTPLSIFAAIMASGIVLGETAIPLEATEQLPIKEVTIFKDGHTFVLHEGLMPVDAQGNVVMDYLPAPVLGTFWPYSNQKDATLRSVTAGKKKVSTQKTALTIRELVEANIGAEVIVTEKIYCGEKFICRAVANNTDITFNSNTKVDFAVGDKICLDFHFKDANYFEQ